MLSKAEQEGLYNVIEAVLGADANLRNARYRFNDQTVEVAEKMIEENAKCNANMKQLVTDLLAGGKVMAKGWLRKAISKAQTQVKRSDSFKGYGCLATTKSRWRTALINTTV